MTETKLQLEDWLDDLCVRFIINLPREELESVERICFQVEEAQWFYEDFVRPLDPALPSLSLKAFAMRIFQHCPLMSQWSEYHHAAAFSEFLAYKTRVPVRGAILLNEAMDKVVLVKGWKKNANWSFPRGKINKEEKDLDCAVREVLEETGYDLKAAGLVKDEKHMKYIEITMREQHMKLYVFRGVPMETVFAPQTRKEISRIEWVSLSDLPTVKKNKQLQQDVVNANKFYMVAPFLHPLKKWIAQQRKIDAKNNVSTISMAYTEGETSMDEGFTSAHNGFTPIQAHLQPAILSDLPEVSPTQDVSSHLKRLLNIGAPVVPPTTTSIATDPSKSNALLSLLRSGSNTAPIPPANMPHQIMQPPFDSHQHPPLRDQTVTFPQRQDISDLSSQISGPSNIQNPPLLNRLFSAIGNPPQSNTANVPSYDQRTSMENVPHQQKERNLNDPPQPTLAPYQRTGDPFAQQTDTGHSQSRAVPPASKLPPPKLTSHSLALLNVFKGNSTSHSQPSGLSGPEDQPLPASKSLAPQDQLLALLKSPSASAPAKPAVELAAQPVRSMPKQILQRPASVNKATELSAKPNMKRHQQDTLTSATVSGPLRTPDFDRIGKQADKLNKTSRVSGSQNVPTTPSITILSRPQSAKQDLPVIPAQSSASPTSSIDSRRKSIGTPKTFQPQILRRSEKLDLNTILPTRTVPVHELSNNLKGLPTESEVVMSPPETIVQPNHDRRPSQTPAQKEALLSLFGKSPNRKPSIIAAAMDHPASGNHYNDSAISSPSLSGVEAAMPAAKSNFGSPPINGTLNGATQRLKSPDNKAFLLGFLQNVAEGKR